MGAYSNSLVPVRNVTSIGFEAACTQDNQVRVGNTHIGSIGGQVGWTSFSDKRYKTNMKENVPGLQFIILLKPITYTVNVNGIQNQFASRKAFTVTSDRSTGLKKDKNEPSYSNTEIVYTGFAAQYVEKAAEQIGFKFSGVDKPKNENGFYGLRYAEFVVPLVRAVQELDSANKVKDKRITKLEEEMMELKEFIRNFSGGNVSSTNAWMKQNTPNPVSVSTRIQYSIPEDVRSARILITNVKGQQLKVYNVNGTGSINFNAGTLPSGTYNYSLVTDGKTITTKKLVIAR